MAELVGDVAEKGDRLRSPGTRAVRPRTENTLRLSRRHLAVLALEAPPVEGVERPKTRGDCAAVERPCPWIGCKHNLYLETSSSGIKFRFPDVEPDAMPAAVSCVLDVADRGGASLQETADALNMVRERVRQIQRSALAAVASAFPDHQGAIEGIATARRPSEGEPRRSRGPKIAALAPHGSAPSKRPDESVPGQTAMGLVGELTEVGISHLVERDRGSPREEQPAMGLSHSALVQPEATGISRTLAPVDGASGEPVPHPVEDAVALGSGVVVTGSDEPGFPVAAQGRSDDAPTLADDAGPSSAPVLLSTDITATVEGPNNDHGGDMATTANGTGHGATHGSNGVADPPVEPPGPTTEDLVHAFETTRAALIERRRALAADLATIEATLGGGPDRKPAPETEGGASAPAPTPKRRGRPPSPTSRASRVLAFVGEHPGTTTGAVASALHRDPGEVAGILFELRRSGRVLGAGQRPQTTWSAITVS